VVQEACLRAFRGIGGFSGVNARAWLLTIVRHAAYTWLGKNRSGSLLIVDDLEAVERKQASAGALSEQAPETPEAALIAKADAATSAAVDPQDDIHASAAYRRSLVGTMVERALKSAAAA